MKKLIFAVTLLLFAWSLLLVATTAQAMNLTCDPQPGITHYKLTGPAWVPPTVPAQPNGSLLMSVDSATQGNNALTVAACIAATPSWPKEECSPFVPFDFARPAIPSGPLNLRLVP